MALYSQIKYHSSEVLVAASYIQSAHCLNSSLPWPALRVLAFMPNCFYSNFCRFPCLTIVYVSKFKCNKVNTPF